MPIPVVTPPSPVTVDGWDAVTLTASATNSPTSWTWTADGGIALTGTGGSRTFTAPALWTGATVTVTVTASNGSGTSAPVTVAVTVRDWNSFVLTRAGTWTPRRPYANIPDAVNLYTGGLPDSTFTDLYTGGLPDSVFTDLYTGGAINVVTRTGTAHLTGAGSLQAFSTSARTGTANLTGTGTLVAFTGSKKVGTAHLTGTGTVTASGTVPPPPPPPPPPGNVKYSAAYITNHIAVDTHWRYSATYGAKRDLLINAILDIGIMHFRDAVASAGLAAMQILASHGRRATLIAGNPWGAGGLISNVSTAISTIKANYGGIIEFVEGPNEPDIQGGSNYASDTHTWMNALYAAVRGDSWFTNIPVKSPSWAFKSGLSAYSSDRSEDYINMHTYMSGDIPESGQLASWISASRAVYGSTAPLSTTEWGYHSDAGAGGNAVDEATYADYLIRGIFWNITHDVKQASNYELFDESDKSGKEAHFGLLRSDGSYKPPATALKNLLGRMVDTGTGTLITSFPYSWTATTSDVQVVPIGRRDGKIDFAVWRAAAVYNFSTNTRITVSPATVTFTLTTAAPVSAFKVGTGALSTVSSSTKSFNVSADGSVLLVRVG